MTYKISIAVEDRLTMDEIADLSRRVGAIVKMHTDPRENRASETPPQGTEAATSAKPSSPGGMPLSQPGTPTPRGSMPTPTVLTDGRGWTVVREDVWSGMVRERDAALAANAQLSEKCDDLRRLSSPLISLEEAEKIRVRWSLAPWPAPPPSASAGTGGETIGLEELQEDLRSTYHEYKGGDWVSWLAVARRAKELLGGSKAVKLPEAKPISAKVDSFSGLDDWAEARGWNNCLAAVRAALAGRGEQ